MSMVENLTKPINTFAANVQIYHTKKSRMSHYFHATWQLHNSPVDCARKLFNFSKDLAVFESVWKKIFGWGFNFIVGDVIYKWSRFRPL